MASSKNQSNLKGLVFEVVKKIPRGKVATYGQIARLIYLRGDVMSSTREHLTGGNLVRFVGWMLHQNKDPKTPCHRVVDRNGRLAPNFAFDGWREQKRRLEAERVKFVDEMHVDLEICQWQI